VLETISTGSSATVSVTTSASNDALALVFGSEDSDTGTSLSVIAIDGDLRPATINSSGYLVLQTISTGSTAIVSVTASSSNDAIDLIFGSQTTDSGEDENIITVDYTELFSWVRSMLGAPIAPVELTDEQLTNCVFNAIYNFNRWRNFKEDLVYEDLVTGSDGNGYIIPPEVGGQDNIIEIIIKPPEYVTYGDEFDFAFSNFFQNIFGSKGSGESSLADYYITLSTVKDVNLILGNVIRWEILNKKLFIYPDPGAGARIAIRFRSALTLDEITNNYFIRNFVLAEAKIILGTIRATFGGTIPGGGEMITIRGESLIAEGKEEKAALIEDMKSASPPLGFEFG
jgi:hypothetical protein